MERDIDASIARHEGSYIRVNEHYIVAQTKHGLLMFNAHALSITQALLDQGSWAWQEIQAMMPYVSGITLDIGAFIGTHSLTFSEKADRVYAFEPHPLAYDNLCTNLLLNNNLKVIPIQCALGNEDGETPLDIQSPEHLNAATGTTVGTGSHKTAIRKLDSLGFSTVQFMKIDVEGYELEVLKGAEKTIGKDHPVIYIECHTEQLVKECSQFLAKMGYVATPLIFTTVLFPENYIPKKDDIHKVYGYLFKRMREPGDD
jgi:FkbM family methyltransferase